MLRHYDTIRSNLAPIAKHECETRATSDFNNRQTISNEEKNEDIADVELKELRRLNNVQCRCSRHYLNPCSAVYIETHILMMKAMTKDEK